MRMTLVMFAVLAMTAGIQSQSRPRARDLGIGPGIMEPGPRNAITDVDRALAGSGATIRPRL